MKIFGKEIVEISDFKQILYIVNRIILESSILLEEFLDSNKFLYEFLYERVNRLEFSYNIL